MRVLRFYFHLAFRAGLPKSVGGYLVSLLVSLNVIGIAGFAGEFIPGARETPRHLLILAMTPVGVALWSLNRHLERLSQSDLEREFSQAPLSILEVITATAYPLVCFGLIVLPYEKL